MIKFITELAVDTGKIIRDAYNKAETDIKYKGEIDIVTKTDILCEEHIIIAIRKQFPDDEILSEEREPVNEGARRKWIIDPLDGTTNFSHRYPFCAISIGLEIDGQLCFGVVYNPILNELFHAEKGKGAYLNNKKITVSNTKLISNSLIETGFPYDRWEKGKFYMKEYLAFTMRCQGVGRAGAAAVDLCYVACGRLDGFFERKLKPWDMAAGSLVVAEARGQLTQFNSKPWHYSSNTIVASNQNIHDKMILILETAHQD
ncbi:MAG: inositol monophosphatase [Candidatus Cloacimonetes bacterium]|nr:inositol monophosphatase [Candidatus Cloacimonadota bacterium]